MSQTLSGTPRADGYRMPGEFEAHNGCWMLWPERPDNWRNGAKPAQEAFTRVAEAISRYERVTMGVSSAQYQNARRMLPPQVRVLELSCNDAWMRDCGPSFVINEQGSLRGVDWVFNAWGGLHGGLYFPWDRDAQVAQKVLEIENADRYKAPFVLEGGAIHVDGQGTLITTEQCLLNLNRNPELGKSEIESYLQDYLNIEKIIWLGDGVYLDETDGHVDNLCCFIRPGVVALTWTDDPDDPQYDISAEAYERLMSATDARGRSLEVHKIHQPGPLYMSTQESQGIDTIESSAPRRAGERLAASYINFYIANGGIIAPVFDDPFDQDALETLAQLFPERQITPVPGHEILLGGGNIHCITQQQPASKPGSS